MHAYARRPIDNPIMHRYYALHDGMESRQRFYWPRKHSPLRAPLLVCRFCKPSQNNLFFHRLESHAMLAIRAAENSAADI